MCHSKIELPSQVSEWESIRTEIYSVKAQVLQKRNQLERQKEIAQLYSRGLSACNERLEKHMSYCSEMDDDLQSLKERLAVELVELQISEEKVEDMIITYLQEREQYRPKKKRKGADKEMKEQVAPRISRRKAEEMKQISNGSKAVGDDDSQEDETSSTSSSRRGKRGRSAVASVEDEDSVSSEKPKRSYTRRSAA